MSAECQQAGLSDGAEACFLDACEQVVPVQGFVELVGVRVQRSLPYQEGLFDRERRENEAEGAIVRLTTRALAAFQPRFYAGGFYALEPRLLLAATPLYSTCCAEFYNDMVDKAPIRRCANETCIKPLFTRQTGRAKKGQHRSHGFIYCSEACASAQTSRRARRKKAAARAAERAAQTGSEPPTSASG
jgi:hypothetical protein